MDEQNSKGLLVGKMVELRYADLSAVCIGKCPTYIYDEMKTKYKKLWGAEFCAPLDDTYIIYLVKQKGVDEAYFDIEQGVRLWPLV